jgi:hypothetical protein
MPRNELGRCRVPPNIRAVCPPHCSIRNQISTTRIPSIVNEIRKEAKRAFLFVDIFLLHRIPHES